MNYFLENSEIKVEISDLGAELQSIKGKRSGFEYLWQGKSPFWTSRSILLFPICGRLFGEKYTYGGKTYEMKLHGFARRRVFDVEKRNENEITFVLKSDDATEKNYPFDFTLKVSYAIEGKKLTVRYDVINDGKGEMPFSIGGHPGFNVPLMDKGDFTDCYVEFEENCSPERLILSQPSFLYSGKHEPFPLEKGRIMRLRHDLFDNDAIFLRNTAKRVSLKSDKCDLKLTMTLGDFDYIGFWHDAKVPAPFVCFEPWRGAPGLDGVVEDFSDKYLMIHLPEGESYSTYFDIEITE